MLDTTEEMDQKIKTLGRYEIRGVIGQGAMGAVYLGKDTTIDRWVAIKCLRPDMLDPQEAGKRRFHQEMRALGRLIHPNIITIFDAGEDPTTGEAYIVMEYLPGVSLRELIKSGGAIEKTDIQRIGVAILNGLEYAHEKGVVHRDIKPGNILLSSDLTIIKVADFGIARVDSGELTQTHQLMGTPQYMSPEHCGQGKVDGRSDLFSVGALLYELFTHTKPFSGETPIEIIQRVMTHTPTPPSILVPTLPQAASDVVMRALEKTPSFRFSSAEEMANALAAIKWDEPTERLALSPSLPSDTIRIQTSPTQKQKRGLVAILSLVVVIVVLWGGSYIYNIYNKEAIVAPTPPLPPPSLLEENGQKEEVIPSLPPAQVEEGMVSLSTDPSGAKVIIDGKIKGITPITLTLPSGTHELILTKLGYHSLEATLQVVAGETTPVSLELAQEDSPRTES